MGVVDAILEAVDHGSGVRVNGNDLDVSDNVSSKEEIQKFLLTHRDLIVQDVTRKWVTSDIYLPDLESKIHRFYNIMDVPKKDIPDFTQKILSNWMANLPESKRKVPIREVFLPGTHDSGAYNVDWSRPIYGKSNLLYWVSKALQFIPIINSVVSKWVLTQEHDIYTQLKQGSRMLDLRVSYNPEDKKFYITHTFTCCTLDKALSDIRRFASEHPTEIVVVNMEPDHEHRAVTNGKEAELKVEIDKLLGERMVTHSKHKPSYNVSLDEAKQTGQNCLISWNGVREMRGVAHNVLSEVWNAASSVSKKIEKLTRCPEIRSDDAKQKGRYFSAAVTPDVDSIKQDLQEMFYSGKAIGNKEVAQKLNQKIAEEFLDRNPEVARKTTGIISDYPSSELTLKCAEQNFTERERKRQSKRKLDKELS